MDLETLHDQKDRTIARVRFTNAPDCDNKPFNQVMQPEGSSHGANHEIMQEVQMHFNNANYFSRPKRSMPVQNDRHSLH
jgi:hypothetical protein